MENSITICSCLGPYRNMTTFTGALLALHPNCQVVNHSGNRFFKNSSINFFKNIDKETIKRFVSWAIDNSTNFDYDRGGPIQRSHAFGSKNNALVSRYKARYGSSVLKKDIKSVFWKESYKLSKYIKNNNISLINFPKEIKFLTPIRNPMDCAYSISSLPQQIKNHNLSTTDPVRIMKFVLKELKWFMDWKSMDKDRFYYYFQTGFTKKKLIKLATFLEISPDKRWISDCLRAYNVQSTYYKSPKMLREYKNTVNSMFSGKFKKKLLGFAR